MQLAAERADQLGQPPLDRHVDVLVVVGERELAPLELAGDPVEAVVELARAPRRVITPAPLERRACAFEPRMSCGHSRRSKPIEALIRANSGSCGWSKRAMAG